MKTTTVTQIFKMHMLNWIQIKNNNFMQENYLNWEECKNIYNSGSISFQK